ncbi:hypothetical protein HSBAA_06800 [Vreelandella sulfidaeris]|uniref:Uncharacterized protein n=1 Tax=Vreelandella sulfidaeris TaxID=115553 RepID=A0A455U761_9GAMM|nr:hypothetical protein HSBAA_06800 [Halomonas sulfidaeris]
MRREEDEREERCFVMLWIVAGCLSKVLVGGGRMVTMFTFLVGCPMFSFLKRKKKHDSQEKPQDQRDPNDLPSSPEEAPTVEPTRPEVEPEPTKPEVEPEPTKPEVEPEPTKPEVEPEPVKPEVEPEPTKPEVEPEPVKPEVEPEPTKPEVEPEPTKPEVEPEPVKPQEKPVAEKG